MARHGISFDDVAEAVDLILKQGDTPTIARIRETLGRGSLTTISRHFNDYKSQHRLESTEALTNSYSDPVSRAVESVWQKMREEADEEIHQIKTDLEAKITRLQQALDEKDQHLEALQHQHQQLTSEHEKLIVHCEQLEEGHQKLQFAGQVKAEQLSSLQQLHETCNAQQQQSINELSSQLAEEKELFKTNQQKYQQQWQAHYKELEHKHEVHIGQLQNQLGNYQFTIEELNADLQRIQLQLDKEKVTNNIFNQIEAQTQHLTHLIQEYQQDQNSDLLTLHNQQNTLEKKLQNLIDDQQQHIELKRFIIRKAQKKRRTA